MQPEVNTPPVPPQPPIADIPAPTADKTTKKKLLVVGGAIAVVIAVAVGIWLWGANAGKSYAKAVPAYETRTKAAYDYFMGLQDRLNQAGKIDSKFKEVTASAPKEPKLLGISFAPKTELKRVNDLTRAINDFTNDYVNAANVSVYSENVLQEMLKVTGSINSVASMNAIAPKFEQAKKTIATFEPPNDVKEFHNNLIKSYENAVKDIHDISAAVDAKDAKTANALIPKLSDDAKPLGANNAQKELEELFNKAYDKADMSFIKLQKLLGVES